MSGPTPPPGYPRCWSWASVQRLGVVSFTQFHLLTYSDCVPGMPGKMAAGPGVQGRARVLTAPVGS